MESKLIIDFIRDTFNEKETFIPLHAPYFGGNEKKYVLDTIESTFVSSVGAYVNRFEEMMAQITGGKFAIATVNGTTALHLALVLAGVEHGDEVITQPLTFVATANAISHAGGVPVFVDVDIDTLGMSPASLKAFLEANCVLADDGKCINRHTGKRIAACLPMHTFGFPLRIKEIADICTAYNIILVEDAAESLGSYIGDRHTGTFGDIGIFSFNGNKTVTCGGGGALITNNEEIARRAKHISTTAKIPHPWEFVHDEIAYNYRMPNLNAALACAQLEQLERFIDNKRSLSNIYKDFFKGTDIEFVEERAATTANYWLNTILFKDKKAQQDFLKDSNDNKVMTRPIWTLMNKLTMYQSCQSGDLTNANWLEERVVNIPSSVRL
jgi:perosamine synthetase